MQPENNLPTPEAVPPPSTPEVEEAVSLEPVEAPAAHEVKKPSEGANQNQGQPLQTTQTSATDDEDDQTATTKTALTDTPAIADDVDVLEKEWTDKAKSIVEKNKEDPYQQNKEMSALKADYMKKRYGKDIKLTEE